MEIFKNYILVGFTFALLYSCQTYEYLHSAQGTDYKPICTGLDTNHLYIAIEGGYLDGTGFNNSNDAGESDNLNYMWGGVSVSKNHKWFDIGILAHIYRGRYSEQRVFIDDTEINEEIPNPLLGDHTFGGLTLGADVFLLPIEMKDGRARPFGISYRTSKDWGTYQRLRERTDPIPRDIGNIDFYTYPADRIHSFGIIQEIIAPLSGEYYLRYGHQLSWAPLNAPEISDIAGGWTSYLGLVHKDFESILQFNWSENLSISYSMRYLF